MNHYEEILVFGQWKYKIPSDKFCEVVFIADTEWLRRWKSLTANASATSILFSISSCYI